MTGPPNCGTENLAAPPRGSSCEMVVARSAVWRYPHRVQGTRAMRGRFKIAALFSRLKLWFGPWAVIREGSAHAGVKRTTTRPDLGCGKALPVSEGT